MLSFLDSTEVNLEAYLVSREENKFDDGFYWKDIPGNGNNEPYDDGTLPDGKIVNKPTDIASAYAVGSCAPIQMKEMDEPKSAPECEKLFNFESPLRLCYPFVDRMPVKKACDFGVAQGAKDIDKMLGSLYTYLCYKSNIPVEMPTHISKCAISNPYL